MKREEGVEDVPALLHQAARAMFGAAALAAEVTLHTLRESAPDRFTPSGDGSTDANELVDALLGLSWRAAHAADALAGRAVGLARPAIRLAMDPPLLPSRFGPGQFLRQSSLTWKSERPAVLRALTDWSAAVAPAASEVAVQLVDLDQLLLDAISRVQLQLLADRTLANLDVDELVNDALAEIDVTRLAEQLLTRLDLTQVADHIIQRLDLNAVVGRALDQIDLTNLVLERVDLQRVITAVLEKLDLTQLIIDRVDLVRLTDFVMDEIDLSELIRDSTGSIASEAMHDIRLQSVEADRIVSRLVDRMLRRNRAEQ